MPDHRVGADFGAGEFRHAAPVAQHDDAVRRLLDLGKAMGDEDHRHTFGLESRNDGQQALGLGRGQARRRLVHNDEPGAHRKRLGDLDELHLGQREFRNGRRRIETGAELVEERLRDPPRPGLVDEAQEPAAQGFAADDHVGAGAEVFEEIELLVHEGDARRHRPGDGQVGHRLSVERNGAAARRDDPAEYLHQRRLAGAVLSDEPDDLAGSDGEVHVIEGRDARIGPGDALHLEKRLRHADGRPRRENPCVRTGRPGG